VQFEDARNLSRGASVLMAGVQVGYVRAVNLVGTPPRAELTLSIQESVKIPRGSTFRISGGALLPPMHGWKLSRPSRWWTICP
jgi:ABC-type transporter Mla subunit MlaD